MKFSLILTLLAVVFFSVTTPTSAQFYESTKEILITQRNNANTFFQQGKKKYDQGKLKEAIANFNKAINLDSNFVQAYVYRGLTYKKQRILDKAIDDYTQSINLSANNPQAQASILYNRGLAYSDLGKIKNSVDDFTQVINITKDKDLKADAYYQRGFIYSEKGSILGKDNYIQKAINDFSETIKIKPSYLGAYVQRGIIYNSYSGDVLKATNDFMKAVRLKPNKDADDYWNMGSARSAIGDLQGALINFNKAISLSPTYSRAYSSRAGIRYLLGDNKGANADVKEAIKNMEQKRPDVSSLYALASVSGYDVTSQQRIYELANRAIADSPEENQDNLLLYLVRGNIRLIQKNAEGALVDFDRVISLNTEFPIAYYFRAFSYLNTLDNLQTSLNDLDTAIKLSPNFPQAYLARGYVYQKLKEPIKSQADFQKVISIYTEVIRRNPNSLDAYTRRRRIYSYLGNIKNAESDLLQVVKLRGRQRITSPLSVCENQRILASFRDLVSSCQ